MLEDFLSLETVFGRGQAALFFDELVGVYGGEKLAQALEQGYLLHRKICIGPDCGRSLCYLSEEGRRAAACAQQV